MSAIPTAPPRRRNQRKGAEALRRKGGLEHATLWRRFRANARDGWVIFSIIAIAFFIACVWLQTANPAIGILLAFVAFLTGAAIVAAFSESNRSRVTYSLIIGSIMLLDLLTALERWWLRPPTLALAEGALSRMVGVHSYEVVRQRLRQWPDGCLGFSHDQCEPGSRMGYEIILRIPSGSEYEFHTDLGSQVLSAPDPIGQAP